LTLEKYDELKDMYDHINKENIYFKDQYLEQNDKINEFKTRIDGLVMKEKQLSEVFKQIKNNSNIDTQR